MPARCNTQFRRSGLALVIVISTLAVATVLSMAMLSASGLAVQMSRSVPRIAQAEYLAESGVHWAIARLRAQAASDEFNTARTYGPLNLRSGGECTITITRQTDREHFRIESRAVYKDGDGKIIAQAGAQATVKATATLSFSQAAIINDSIDYRGGSTGIFTFDSLAANGGVRIDSPSSVNTNGLAFAERFNSPTNIAQSKRISPFIASGVPIDPGGNFRPSSAAMRTYEQYVWTDGKTYSAATVPVTGGRLASRTLTATASNPAGVYRHSGDLTIGNGVVIRGTLVVLNGDLTLEGPGGSSSYACEIDATNSWSLGLPALVLTNGDLIYANPNPVNKLLRVQGVTWVSGMIGANGNQGSNSQLQFEGATIVAGSAPKSRGTVTFLYRTTNNDVFTFDKTLISQITVESWGKLSG